MVCVGPGVCRTVDGVRECKNGVSAAVSGYEVRIFESEIDVLSADVELRGLGHSHVTGAGYGGLAVCRLCEVFGCDGVDESPVV